MAVYNTSSIGAFNLWISSINSTSHGSTKFKIETSSDGFERAYPVKVLILVPNFVEHIVAKVVLPNQLFPEKRICQRGFPLVLALIKAVSKTALI